MILTVKVQNYQSIRDEMTIDFTVGRHAPMTGNFAATPEKDSRATLTQAFMGANGSGKSTALKAIAAVRWIIVRSFRDDDDLPVRSFAGLSDHDTPTKISVTFCLNQEIHIYEIIASRDRILNEKLSVRSTTTERTTTKQVFKRSWNEESRVYDIADNSLRLPGEYWGSDELKNASILAAAQRFGNEYANRVVDYWRHVTTNIEIEERFRPQEIEAYFAVKYYSTHPESRANVEKDIRRYDLGIEGFGDEGMIKHKYEDGFFELSADQESSGTMQILLLHRKMEQVLEKGGVAIIDEFDAFLHPIMTKEMIGKFTDPLVNKGSGQLIFSSHDVSILDYLTKYEVHIVEKNDDGVTHVQRVDNFSGVRNTQDLKKRYLAGVFRGVPKLLPREDRKNEREETGR